MGLNDCAQIVPQRFRIVAPFFEPVFKKQVWGSQNSSPMGVEGWKLGNEHKTLFSTCN